MLCQLHKQVYDAILRIKSLPVMFFDFHFPVEDQPFTITLKYTDGKWLLDDCTYVEGFADHFCADIFEEYDDYTGNDAVTKRYPIG